MKREEEEKIKEYWKKKKVYDKLKKRQGKKFYFLDGPPYATGYIHMGTAWNKVLKDAYIRFWRMKGRDVWDRPGYDTHGLPIENKVEKELGIKSKSDIERLGVEKFILACRNFATKFIEIMNKQFEDLGVWMDWKNPYLTLENSYIEGAWATFKTSFEKGLLYKGLYPVHVCSHCVDPNSTILVEGGTRKIKELKNCWRHNKVLSVDTESGELTITKPLGYMEHEEDAFVLETKTGKRLTASPDHPFWTQQGWVQLSKLNPGAKVAVYNNVESRLPKITEKGSVILNENRIRSFIERLEKPMLAAKNNTYNDMTSSSKNKVKDYVFGLRSAGFSYNEIVNKVRSKYKVKVAKSWIAKILKTSTKTRNDSIVSELKEKSLLPLYSKSSAAFILSRIAGHIFGDGSIAIKFSKNRKFPVFYTSFCGKEEDLEEIRKDLNILGFECTEISTTETKSVVNNRIINGFTTSMRCNSSALAVLLISLGCPMGRKTEKKTYVPKWIKSNKKLTRDFLASYFGSELQIIGTMAYEKGFNCLRLYLTKERHLEKNGLEFAKDVCELIKKFGVTTSQIKAKRTKVNEKDKSKITISIDCNDDNLIRFTRFLGYEYCKYRKTRAAYVLSYLLNKKSLEKEYRRKKNSILKLRQSKVPCSKIAIKLGLPKLYVRHVVYGKAKNIIVSKYISPFNEWLKKSADSLRDGLIWDEIETIKYLGKRKVCDIAVETHHNFITNGFLTHNCETAVAYNEIEYAKVSDPSVYVKFKVHGKKDEFIVIWTTTPWTLPSNTGVMAKPDADYVKIQSGGMKLILAKELLETVAKKVGIEDYDIIEIFKGRKLEGLKYDHPLSDEFEFQKKLSGAHRVILSDQYVTLDTGTGLVHTAPGHGQEDYKVGIENGLPVVSPVKMNGTYNDECGKFAGIFVKHADKLIIKNLREKGLLLREETITHDYPQCWRCNSLLLQLSVPQWFFRVTEIREKLIEENEKVSWYPSWAKQRFRNWLESLGDWPISRQRYWGIPLPIWTCKKCDKVRVVGSAKELGKAVKDLHRPYIDEVKLKCACGSQMERIKDVLDVWFDSGLAAWASIGYPKNKKLFKSLWKTDLEIEGPDQIRGWWNSQLITSVITFGESPFTSILFHGFVLDAHGVKMSKSKGNIVNPEEVVNKYGTDVLRMYLLSSPPWEDFYFKWIDVENVSKSFVVIENTFNFVKTYASGKGLEGNMLPEDRWIISRMNSLTKSFAENMESYNIHKASQELVDFIVNDFSRWYIKIIRNRVWPSYGGEDKKGAVFALRTVSKNILTLMAPICPFVSEKLNIEIFGDESVHLKLLPKPDKVDSKAESQMAVAREIVETCNSIRKENSLKLKWPMESIWIEPKDSENVGDAVKTFGDVIIDMANAGKIEKCHGYKKEFSGGTVHMSKEVMKNEALLRELLRAVQEKRKNDGMNVSDKITLYIDGDMKKFEKQIKEKVSAGKIVFKKLHDGEEVEFEDMKLKFLVERV